jgi:hypothetical protein
VRYVSAAGFVGGPRRRRKLNGSVARYDTREQHRAKAEGVAVAPADILFDNTNFLAAYQNDMMSATRETVIVSPFVTRRRALQMLPNMEPPVTICLGCRAFSRNAVGTQKEAVERERRLNLESHAFWVVLSRESHPADTVACNR